MLLQRDGFPSHLFSHTAAYLPPFLACTTRFSSASGAGDETANAPMAVHCTLSAKPPAISIHLKNGMKYSSTSVGQTDHQLTGNVLGLRACSNDAPYYDERLDLNAP